MRRPGLRDPQRLVRGVWDPSPLIVLGARAVEAAALPPGGHGRHSALLQLRSPTVVLQERKEALFVPSDRAKFGTGKIIPFWLNSEDLVSLDAEKICIVSLAWTLPFLHAIQTLPLFQPVSSSTSFITTFLTLLAYMSSKYIGAQTQHAACTLTYVFSVVSLRVGSRFCVFVFVDSMLHSTGLGTETALSKLLLINWYIN